MEKIKTIKSFDTFDEFYQDLCTEIEKRKQISVWGYMINPSLSNYEKAIGICNELLYFVDDRIDFQETISMIETKFNEDNILVSIDKGFIMNDKIKAIGIYRTEE